jgi:lipoprotein NlpI
MPDPQKSVFISYRRSASAFIARAIFQNLREHGFDAFMDVESIDAGHFEQIILNQVEARAHVLVVLAPGTVERFAEANDMMRREIEYAMDKGRNIVPLLVTGFSFGDAKAYLTGKLAELPGYNGVPVSHDYFDEAMERVRTRFLTKRMTGEIKAAPPSEQNVVQQKINEVMAQPTPTATQLSAEAVFAQAFSAQMAGNLDQAFAGYNEAIRLNPQFGYAYNNRGWIHFLRRNFDAAIADYTEALRFMPGYGLAYINRGLAYLNRGQPDAAINDYTSAITAQPQNAAGAYFQRGNAYFTMGNAAAALYDYNLALTANPQFPEAYNARGWLYYTMGNFNGALYDYNTAIGVNAQFPLPYRNRGILYNQMGNAAWAVNDYQTYLNLGGGQQNGDQMLVEQWIRSLRMTFGL